MKIFINLGVSKKIQTETSGLKNAFSYSKMSKNQVAILENWIFLRGCSVEKNPKGKGVFGLGNAFSIQKYQKTNGPFWKIEF